MSSLRRPPAREEPRPAGLALSKASAVAKCRGPQECESHAKFTEVPFESKRRLGRVCWRPSEAYRKISQRCDNSCGRGLEEKRCLIVFCRVLLRRPLGSS